MANKNGVKGKGRDKRIDVVIGANIRHYRNERGMSQAELARHMGRLTFQQVQKYENGKNSVAGSRFPSLCLALGVTLEQLFEGTMGVNMKAPPVTELSPRALRFGKEFDRLDDRVAGRLGGLIDAVLETST